MTHTAVSHDTPRSCAATTSHPRPKPTAQPARHRPEPRRIPSGALKVALGALRGKITAKPVHDKSIRSYFQARQRAVNTLLDTSELLNGKRPDADDRLIQAVLAHREPKPTRQA